MSKKDGNWLVGVILLVILLSTLAFGQSTPEDAMSAPNGLILSVKEMGPATERSDLQVICILKQDVRGNRYTDAMADLNGRLGNLLSSLQERGEFEGELGDTLLITPPAGAIAARQLLLIGVGAEADLSIDRLGLVGRIAAREAIRLRATSVAFAPTLRDQGSRRIDVGDGDAATAGQFLLAFDTEARLAAQKLAETPTVKTFVIEAGPKFFQAASDKVAQAVNAAAAQIEKRSGAPYLASAK